MYYRYGELSADESVDREDKLMLGAMVFFLVVALLYSGWLAHIWGKNWFYFWLATEMPARRKKPWQSKDGGLLWRGSRFEHGPISLTFGCQQGTGYGVFALNGDGEERSLFTCEHDGETYKGGDNRAWQCWKWVEMGEPPSTFSQPWLFRLWLSLRKAKLERLCEGLVAELQQGHVGLLSCGNDGCVCTTSRSSYLITQDGAGGWCGLSVRTASGGWKWLAAYHDHIGDSSLVPLCAEVARRLDMSVFTNVTVV